MEGAEVGDLLLEPGLGVEASEPGWVAVAAGGNEAGGVAVVTTACADLSRSRRHGFNIAEQPRYRPLGLSPGFVPHKSCLDFVRDECADALATIRQHVPALIYAAQQVVSSLDLDLVRELDPQMVVAMVCYTLDVSQYAIGISADANFYQAINRALKQRDPEVLLQLAGYLYYLLSALDRLPKEPEGEFFRGIGPDAISNIAAHYQLGTQVVWSGITSTSRCLAKAVEFARVGGVVFRVRATSGVSVKDFSSFPEEEEVLFAPNFKAQVSRSLYSDPAYPHIRFIDLAESRARRHVF